MACESNEWESYPITKDNCFCAELSVAQIVSNLEGFMCKAPSRRGAGVR